MQEVSWEVAASLLSEGKIGVIPTDTIYGLVASALDADAVERVYRVRGRDQGKPFIVLLGDVPDLDIFLGESEAYSTGDSLVPDRGRSYPRMIPDEVVSSLKRWWPGKVSVVLPCPDERWAYLHRGTGTIAFRVPDKDDLRELLRKTGPLISPSTNPQGKRPAETLAEADGYFGDCVDFGVDGGRISGEPSTVIQFSDGRFRVLRPGAVRIA